MNPRVYFIESLTVRSWLVSIWPRLLRDRGLGGSNPARCFYFDASGLALYLVWATAWAVGVQVERLEYKLKDVTDEFGQPIRKRVDGQDLAIAQKQAMRFPSIQSALNGIHDRPRFSPFLAKRVMLTPPPSLHSIRKAIYMVHIASWQVRRMGLQNSPTTLFVERAPWLESVNSIAEGRGIDLTPAARSFNLRRYMRNILPREVANVLLLMRQGRTREAFGLFNKRLFKAQNKIAAKKPAVNANSRQTPAPQYVVAAEFTGQMNLDYPERHSNFFFWQQSRLKGSDIMVTFTAATCPLDESNWNELSRSGMSAVVTYPGASLVAHAPVYSRSSSQARSAGLKLSGIRNGLEKKWLKQQFSEYERLRHFWTDLFHQNDVRVFVTYNKLDAPICAISDAIQSLGGISVNYERSFASFASPDFNASSDVMFNFSQTSVDLEMESGSYTGYQVVTGYLGDHRFPLIKESARSIREDLKNNGSKHIVAFFDENAPDDDRFSLGHGLTRENYSFLLEKVLANDWFGLVLKPKSPTTLHRRLGPVSELLKQAEATGRCFMFHEGGMPCLHPPSAAAFAADIAIHGHLWAGTAGIEAALAGVPTLLMDLEGWKVEPLYGLGLGRVVFEDWDGLWEACSQHWSSADGIPDFGDWGSTLDKLDPFRDGRAAERMGTYIEWLLEGLRSGQDRDTVLANTAERYCAQWGHDKVTHGKFKARQGSQATRGPDLARSS